MEGETKPVIPPGVDDDCFGLVLPPPTKFVVVALPNPDVPAMVVPARVVVVPTAKAVVVVAVAPKTVVVVPKPEEPVPKADVVPPTAAVVVAAKEEGGNDELPAPATVVPATEAIEVRLPALLLLPLQGRAFTKIS